MFISKNPLVSMSLEGEAILKTVSKTQRVVQIGTQRRSTHHLIDAKERIIDAGLLGEISHVEIVLLLSYEGQ